MDLINVLMSLLQSLIQPFFQQSQQQPDRESQQLIDASIQVMAVFANDHENVHKIKNNDNLMQTLIGVSANNQESTDLTRPLPDSSYFYLFRCCEYQHCKQHLVHCWAQCVLLIHLL